MDSSPFGNTGWTISSTADQARDYIAAANLPPISSDVMEKISTLYDESGSSSWCINAGRRPAPSENPLG